MSGIMAFFLFPGNKCFITESIPTNDASACIDLKTVCVGKYLFWKFVQRTMKNGRLAHVISQKI